MPAFTYKVRDKVGKVVQGKMDAINNKDLRKKLDEQGYFIIEYSEVKDKKDILLEDVLPIGKKVTDNDLSVFSWQLFTMLNAGLPLLNALKILEKQIKNPTLKRALNDVWRRIEEGNSFSESLREHPRIFSRLYVQMINAGEVGGVLDEMIKRLAIFHETQAQTKAKITSAMIYPVILFTISIAVVLFLIMYVLPQFAAVFNDMDVVIPVPTQILIVLSSIIVSNWYILVALPIGLFFIYKIYSSTRIGRLNIDQIKINLPLVGDIIRKTTAARFTQTLSTLLSGGIPILTALEVVTETIGNMVVVKALRGVMAMVGEGKSIAKPLSECKVFPDMVVNMIGVGEETGALDKMLEKVAEFYDREVNNSIEIFTKLIEPVLIVVMTMVIGFIAICIFLPMTDIMQGFHG